MIARANNPPSEGIVVTAAGKRRLQEELETMRRHAREDIATRMREARSFGSDSNNDEYYALREEQLVHEARMAMLEDLIHRARVVSTDAAQEGVADIGRVVVIEDLETREFGTYELAAAHKDSDGNVITAASPLGQALLGAAPGAVVTVELPRGRTRSVRLVSLGDAA